MATAWDIAADIIDPTDAWKPFPKQRLASRLAARADETLFGGAAGPGKTEWGMEHVIRQMEDYPGNRGAIFRRMYPSLERTIIPRLKMKLFSRAVWNGQTNSWAFPNGSVLEVASLQYADDVVKFQGAEYGVIFFEELTEFLEEQWEFLIGRLRAPVDGVRPHAIATTNPGGRGHTWVKRRFVKPKPDDLEPGDPRPQPGVVWRPRRTQERPEPATRVFVPSTLADNPVLAARDPGYINRVRGISNRGLRLAMEKGDWDAIDSVEGALWKASELDMGRVRDKPTEVARRVTAVDPSDGEETGDAFGVSVCSRGMDGVGYVEHAAEWRNVSVRRMAEQAVRLYHDTKSDALVIERNHGGKWMLEVFQQVDPYVNIEDVWASDGKRTRAEPVAALFEPIPDPTLMKFRARLVGFHEELEERMTTFTGKPGEVSPNDLDAMVWAMSSLFIGNPIARHDTEYDDRRHQGRR